MLFRKWMKRRNDIIRAEYTTARNKAECMKQEAKTQAWEKIGDELELDMQGS